MDNPWRTRGRARGPRPPPPHHPQQQFRGPQPFPPQVRNNPPQVVPKQEIRPSRVINTF